MLLARGHASIQTDSTSRLSFTSPPASPTRRPLSLSPYFSQSPTQTKEQRWYQPSDRREILSPLTKQAHINLQMNAVTKARGIGRLLARGGLSCLHPNLRRTDTGLLSEEEEEGEEEEEEGGKKREQTK